MIAFDYRDFGTMNETGVGAAIACNKVPGIAMPLSVRLGLLDSNAFSCCSATKLSLYLVFLYLLCYTERSLEVGLWRIFGSAMSCRCASLIPAGATNGQLSVRERI